MNHIWAPNPWSGPPAPKGSSDDKLSQPELCGGQGDLGPRALMCLP